MGVGLKVPDWAFQWRTALGVLDADGHGGHVDLGPGEHDRLGEAHAGVEAKAQGVACHRIALLVG